EGVLDHLKHAAADLAEAAVEKAGDVAEDVIDAVKETAEGVVDAVKEKAEDVVERVKGQPSLTSVDSAADLRQRGQLGYTGEVLGRTVTLDELEKIEREMAEEYGAATPATDEELLRLYESRSEERRVGKECRSRRAPGA